MKYTIKKGQHFAQWWWIRWLWSLHYGDTIKATVIFHESCAYKHPKPQWDKSFGWGYLWNPDKHSARFVHQYYRDEFTHELTVSYYIHEAGKHDGAENSERYTWNIPLNHRRTFTIRKENVKGKTLLHFSCNFGYHHSELTEIPYSKWGWKLYPNVARNPAAQDTHITVKEINPGFARFILPLLLIITITILFIWITEWIYG